MFDIGWTELLVIGLVALIVVGPKDLPGMFRALGKFTAKARRMARDFQRAMEEAADDSGMKDAAQTFKSMSNPRKMGLDALNDAADKFDKWEPGKGSIAADSKPAPPPDAADEAAADAADAAEAEETAKPAARKTPAEEARERGA